MKDYLQSIADEVKDIFSHDIETSKTFVVPGRDDVGLTFGRNQIKKGKLIETCVLFIDIRNSTIISKNLKKDKAKLGKIYSAFIHAMVSIADKYGYVRNIIGDRVMVVFEPNNCFIDSINCAATMYSVSYGILKKYSGIDTFKVGIGIDFGEMLILKTGILKNHTEKSEYKNLVWVGDAANIASKLTDLANKEYNNPLYTLSYEDIVFENVLTGHTKSPTPLSLADAYLGKTNLIPVYEVKMATKTYSVTLSGEEFNKKVSISQGSWLYDGKSIKSLIKEERQGTTSPVLMSGKVYNEFKTADPKSIHLKRLCQKTYPIQAPTSLGIFGGTPLWTEINQVK